MTDKIFQQEIGDCGVASLAMLLGIAYDTVRDAFIVEGLHLKRGRKIPYSSNFSDLKKVAKRLGYATLMKRFTDWSCVTDKAIVKVMVRKNGNWHWVVAERSPTGIVIYDPGIDLMSYENPTLNEATIDFLQYQPEGNFITLMKMCTK